MLELRTPISDDIARDCSWSQDHEVSSLDPAVGVVFNMMRWSIYADGIHIGMISAFNISHSDAELGIRIGEKSYWSKGFGMEAIQQIVVFCFHTLGLQRLYLKVLPNNIRAIKCYKKVGFREIGLFQQEGYTFLKMMKEEV